MSNNTSSTSTEVEIEIECPTGKRNGWSDAKWDQLWLYEKQERKREAARHAVIDNRRKWIKARGVKRIANMVATRLERKGFRVEIEGTESLYVLAYNDYGFFADVRISLHQQAVGGGYNVGTQERMGETLVSIDPHTSTTVEDAVLAVAAESD